MKIKLLLIGESEPNFIREGLALYEQRIKKYLPFELEVIPDIKKAGSYPTEERKKREGELILAKLKPEDLLVLLDERGQTYGSIKWSDWLDKTISSSAKNIVFLIGGSYGFSNEIYSRANQQLSLSSFTFSHQLARVVFTEQLYRALTIIKNEPYHNE